MPSSTTSRSPSRRSSSSGSSLRLLPTKAAERLARRRREQPPSHLPLREWIPRYVRGHREPDHLGPLLDLLDRAEREPVQAVVHAPPRHGKTETILAAIARMIQRHPHKTNAYATYESNLAKSKSRKVRDLAR